MHNTIVGIFGSLFSLAFTGMVIFGLIAYKVGKGAAKLAPWIGVPLLLVGLLVLFPRVAPWFRKRWNMAADAVRPEGKPEPESADDNTILYVQHVDPRTGEVTFIPA